MFRFRTLGSLDLTADDGRTVQSVLAQPKRIALLAYLVVAPPRGFHRRDSLLGVFWPESDEERARNSLRQSIHFLRRSFEEKLLIGRGDDELGIEREQLWCDVFEFERLLAAGQPEAALELYQGEFLPGLYVSQAPEFERWVDRERSRLSAAAAGAAWQVADARGAAGDSAGAIEFARRALELSPLDEAGLRRLLTLYDRQGDRAGAAQLYGEFCRRLEVELEIEPSAETQALMDAIRSRAAAHPATAPSAPPAGEPPRAERGPERALDHAQHAVQLVGSSVALEDEQTDVSAAEPEPLAAPRPRLRVQIARPPDQGWSRRRRSLVAGGVFLALLGGMVGAWNLARASLAAEDAVPTRGVQLAVLPFAVHGSPEVAYLREGMVDVLTTSLDGAGDLVAVDRNRVLRHVGEDDGEPIDPAAGARFTRSLDAKLFVTGTVLEVGGGLQVAASLYRVERAPFLLWTRARPVLVTQAVADGDRSDLLRISDALSTKLLMGYHEGPAGHLPQVAALTTSSFAALKAFLHGEDALRSGRMRAASEAFGQAIAEDSAFALARYRLAVVAEWLGQWAVADREAEAALRHSGRLAEHDRWLLEAFASRRRGDVLDADRYYRAVLASHPDELEGWWMRGDLLLRFGPLRGHPMVNAREPLERALLLDSEHQPARWALATIAASQSYLGRADSLFAAWPDNEDALTFALLRSLITRDSVLSPQLEQQLARAGDHALFRAVSTAAALSRNIPQSIAAGLLLTAPSRSAHLHRQGHAALAALQLARGNLSGARVELARLERIDPEWANLMRAQIALLPFMSTTASELRAARDGLLTEQHPDPRMDGVQAAMQLPVDPAGSDLRRYLHGLLSLRLGDTETATRMAARLEARSEAADASPLAFQWAQSIRAELAHLDRRPEDALLLLDFTRTAPLEQATSTPFLTMAHARYVRAEILFQSGRYTEALEVYRSLESGSVYDVWYLAATYLRQAEILEYLNQPEAAARHYRRVLQVLDHPDPRFASTLASARRRLEALDPAALR